MTGVNGTWLKSELLQEAIRLEKMVQRQASEIESLRAELELAQKINNERQVRPRNERGAGRKPRLTREMYGDIMCRRNGGDSYRQIAKSLGVSVGLVGKACNMSETEVDQLGHETPPVQISNYVLRLIQ